MANVGEMGHLVAPSAVPLFGHPVRAAEQSSLFGLDFWPNRNLNRI